MMMLNMQTSSSFTSKIFSSQGKDNFLKPVRFPKNLKIHETWNRSSSKKHLKNGLQISSVSANNAESFEKPAKELYKLQHEHTSNVKDDSQTSLWETALKQLDIFIRFTRPYAIIGTVIGVTAVSLLPVQTVADLSPSFFKGLMQVMVPAIFMNIYVAGVNQIYDIEIDKINKPELPLASGELSMGAGVAITAAVCLMSFGLAFMTQSPPIIYALILDFLIGSAYSVDLPFLRWKKNPYLTIFCIASRRAIFTPLACYAHIQKYVLGRPFALTRSLTFALAFVSLFFTVISVFKDIPDVDGDKDHGIQSLSISLGQERVFWLCINSLLTGYCVAMGIGASSSVLLNKLITVVGHGTFAFILWLRARSTNIKDKSETDDLYVFLWKLMFAEYFLIPFVR